jgi:hypothetical protein
MYLKQEPWRSERWLRAVASLHCVRCFKEGRTQAAHRNVGKGLGMKVDDMLTAALCVECHSEIEREHGHERSGQAGLLGVY